MKSIRGLILLITLVFSSCSSKQSTTAIYNEPHDSKTITNLSPEVALEDYLRKFSGVIVKGSGVAATVLIRSGGNSIMNSSEPLFLINGIQFNGNYASLRGTISVNQIKSVTVLKNASDTAFYGLRGANGVIGLTLK
tara:strand:- start:4871 stop:5281 length:411 start_codon:yes stop_codon:yes gene_type:complete